MRGVAHIKVKALRVKLSDLYYKYTVTKQNDRTIETGLKINVTNNSFTNVFMCCGILIFTSHVVTKAR